VACADRHARRHSNLIVNCIHSACGAATLVSAGSLFFTPPGSLALLCGVLTNLVAIGFGLRSPVTSDHTSARTVVATIAWAFGIWASHFLLLAFVGSSVPLDISSAGIDASALAFLMALSITAMWATWDMRGLHPAIAVGVKATMLTTAVMVTQVVGMRAMPPDIQQDYNIGVLCSGILLGLISMICGFQTLRRGRLWLATGFIGIGTIVEQWSFMAAMAMILGNNDHKVSVNSGLIVSQSALSSGVGGVALLVLLSAIGVSRWCRHRRDRETPGFEAFGLIASTTFDGLILENNGRVQQANQMMHELAGAERGALVGRSLATVISGLVLDSHSEGQTITCDIVWPDHSKRAVEVKHQRSELHGGNIVAVRDLSRQRASESLIQRMANTDPLTQLLNRGAFELNAQNAIETALHESGSVAVLHIGINRFAVLAEDLGSAVADQVLIQLAQRLRRCIRQTDYLARIGREEFAVLQSTNSLSIDAVALAERVLRETEAPFAIGDQAAIASVSVGIALFPSDGPSARELIRNAGLATRQARLDGRGRWRHFDASMNADAQQRQLIQRDLHLAQKNNQLVVHYQPFVDAITLETAGYEALLRWQHPERGLIFPVDFIQSAEESGLIVSIGTWVLEAACREAAGWPQPKMIAVNLSPAQLEQAGVVRMIAEVLEQTGLPAERLELEITETTLMGDKANTLQVLKALKALGVQLAMDDFGTGYSSLNYLRTFPFDKIKIDRSFIQDCDSNAEAKSIVQCIVAMGTALHLKITAEGVETNAQLGTLRDYGCDYLQGYLLGNALPVAVHMQVAERTSGTDALAGTSPS
jgi:diguanylate cyclase